MRYPRSRAIHAAGFVIPIAMLAALLLLFVRGSVQAQVSLPAGQSPPGSPETPWDYPVCFTGQDHVDLKWGIDPWYTTYVIMRDGAELKRFSTTVTFYRDRSVAKGETYTYQICAQHESDPPSCGLSSTTTVGQIRGTLYDV